MPKLGEPFRQPSGVLGLAGAWLMARAGRPVHEFAIGLLAAQPGQHVLEIGPAHGALTERLAAMTDGLRVTAVDPSPDMVALTARRNRALVEEGRVVVREGNVSSIPCEEHTFDGVVTTNTIYFWPDLAADLPEIARVMKPGGRLVIVFRAGPSSSGEWCVARNGGTSRPSSLSIAELEAAVGRSGFGASRKVLRHFGRSLLLGRVAAGAVVAVRS